jgi:S1-C subfamily serine protease
MQKIIRNLSVGFIFSLLSGIAIGQPDQDKYAASSNNTIKKNSVLSINKELLKYSSYLSISQKLSIGNDVLPDGRSLKDASLFKSQSPSVVLIMTEDGLGSGSLISADGLILTNKHVVGDNKKVGVFFKPDKDTVKVLREALILGEVVKIDDVTDLALVKVKNVPQGRIPIKFGGDDDIGIGLDVHAIGHPKGEYWTYTKGVISQYRPDFEWQSEENKPKHKATVIQTQTPINPGNSGGPLFLDSGVLVGVNSFKNSNAEGLNFAVSIDVVKEFIKRKGDRLVLNTNTKSKEKCEPKVLYDGRTQKNNAKIVVLDTNCSGRKNIDFIYPDDSKEPNLARLYRNNDQKADAIIYSYSRNDKWDISFWDNDYNNTWTTVGLHPDGDLIPQKYISRAEYDKR